MPKMLPKSMMWLLGLVLAVPFAVSSSATAQSPLERHRDKLHRSNDCDLYCDVDWPTWEHRSSDFTVQVSFRGEAISGVKVTLTSEDPLPDGTGRHVMATLATGVNGVARFTKIPPGKYIAHVNEGLLAQSQDLEVEAEYTNTDTVELEWPMAPIATRNVRGWLSGWEKLTPQNRSHRQPLADVQVQLFDLRSGKLLDSTRTSDDGYYEFPNSDDGLYVVRVSEGQYPAMQGYDQAIEVAANAVSEQMPGFVVDHVCGLGLSVLNPRHDSQDPCVPTGARDPNPPIRYYEPYYRVYPSTVIIMQQQVVVIR
jgi:hypothetical protein